MSKENIIKADTVTSTDELNLLDGLIKYNSEYNIESVNIEIKEPFDGYDLTEKEKKEIVNEINEIDKSNVIDIINHPIYFLKFIISFFNKGIYFNKYIMELKSEADIKNKEKMSNKNDSKKNKSYKNKEKEEDSKINELKEKSSHEKKKGKIEKKGKKPTDEKKENEVSKENEKNEKNKGKEVNEENKEKKENKEKQENKENKEEININDYKITKIDKENEQKTENKSQFDIKIKEDKDNKNINVSKSQKLNIEENNNQINNQNLNENIGFQSKSLEIEKENKSILNNKEEQISLDENKNINMKSDSDHIINYEDRNQINEYSQKDEKNDNENSQKKQKISDLSNGLSSSVDDSITRNDKSFVTITFDVSKINAIDIIFAKEKTNVLTFVDKNILNGDIFEDMAIKNFKLFCNYSLIRNIKIENNNHKSSNLINSFFLKLKIQNLLKDFQIDMNIGEISGTEIIEIYRNFKNNFFFFQESYIIKENNYQIICEIAKDIIDQSKQKLPQIINYIHLIKNLNQIIKTELKDDNKNFFENICREYNISEKNEKLFLILTDGSFFELKYMTNFIKDNYKSYEVYMNLDFPKNEIIKYINNLIYKDKLAKILEINPEKLYMFCNLYYHLKKSNIKFFICFISETIEDKFENNIRNKIKNYFNYIINNKDIKMKEFLITYKKNEDLRIKFATITDKMKSLIKQFIHNKEYQFFENIKKYILNYFKEKEEDCNNLAKSLISNINFSKLNETKLIYDKNKFLLLIIILINNEEKMDLLISSIKEKIKNTYRYEILLVSEADEIKQNIKSIKEKYKYYYIHKLFLTSKKFYIDNCEKEEIIHLLNETFVYDFKNKYRNCIPLMISDFFLNFYSKNKYNFSKNETLKSDNLLQKIKFDLNKFSINIEESSSLEDNCKNLISFEDNRDKLIYTKANEYYKDFSNMIKELVNLAKIRENSYEFPSFNNLYNYFKIQFKVLIENLRCKYFYFYFWCQYFSEQFFRFVYSNDKEFEEVVIGVAKKTNKK